MNEIIRLEPYSQIRHGGIASLVVDQGPLGVTVTREADGKIAFDELTYDEINDGLKTGHIVVLDGYHSEEAARQRTKFGEQVVSQLPRKQRGKVFFRQTWCDFFLGHVDKWRTHRRIEVMSMKPRKLSAVLS